MINIFKENERFREQYFQSVKKFVENLNEKFSFSNLDTVKSIVGYPLNLQRTAPKLLIKEKCLESENYTLYRVQIESFLGIRVFGLLAEPNIKSESKTAVVFQHGGGDSPERVFGLIEDTVYKATADYIARQGLAVFAPQLLLWNKSEYGTSFEREDRYVFDKKLKEHGGSITALELHCIQSVADYLLNAKITDKLAMGGMSYGGMYTLYTLAVDERFIAGYSSSWFNDRIKYNWVDWTYGGKTFCDYEVVKSIFPRKVFIEVGNQDEMFDVNSAIQEYDKIKECVNYQKYCTFNVYDGKHEINFNRTVLDNFIKFIL